jgi:flagellar basal body-associated protein FliL
MRTEVSSADGREKLKADIKKRVNSELGEDDVDDVYFSNFVTQ